MIENAQNKMMGEAPDEKSGFHFPGGDLFKSAYIFAHNIEAATKVWLETRVPLNASTTTVSVPEETVKPTETVGAESAILPAEDKKE